ncbi:MAG: SdiA-regulated domain-containing protein [Lewinellaceae bacterium]|nr:SdiA-regulated domain-containing protein [Lewinellaceae bacterium]
MHKLLALVLPAIAIFATTTPLHSIGVAPGRHDTDTDSIPYRLNQPAQVINLVYEELQEISGLGPADEPNVFCAISDERGEVLFIDGNGGGAILRRVLFREKGDFEGVEMVDNCLYAVKSNGEIYEIARWKRDTPKVSSIKTFLTKTDDVEGLGHDKKRQALLLACKGDPDSAYIRNIYAFDLRTKQLGETPVFTVNPHEVNALIPYDDDDKQHFFSPSGVAIHPVTGDVYIISTALKRIVVLDYNTGKIRYAIRLDKKILPQPEGISFDSEGNLFLASEGKKGEGLLLRFDFIKG